MRKLILSFLLLIFLIIGLYSNSYANSYKVLKVVDGDTIDIQYQGQKERIRLLSVDTPESVHPDHSKNTPMGKKASQYTKSRLKDKYVSLEFGKKKRGKYGRLLAYVILNGNNYNLELVRQGWSPYYVKYGKSEKHHSEFLAAEKQAKEEKLNIWGNSFNETEEPNTSILYRGNTKSHKFHRNSCRYYNCKKCTRKFNSRKSAIEAGYIPCKVCKP